MATNGPSPHSPSLRLGTSLPPRRWATTCCRLSLHPCPAPLSCSLQPLLKLLLSSLEPSLLQFESIVSLLLNHGNPIFESVCAFYLFFFCLCFLIEMNFSFKSLFAIWSLSSHRFHYHFCLCILSWQYQKHWTILILVLCLLCVTPLGCSPYSSFAPSLPFQVFSSWWQRDCDSTFFLVPAAILLCSISMAVAKISTSGAPGPTRLNVAFPPSPIHLVTAFNHDWFLRKYSNGSSIGISRSASKNAANSGWFELEPSSSRPTHQKNTLVK